MTIPIEQDADALKLAVEVHRNANLAKIRMSRAKVSSDLFESIEDGAVAVEFKFKGRSLEIGKDRLVVEISFSMAGFGPDPGEAGAKRDAVVRVDCAFEATYELVSGFVLTREHAEAFHSGNAIFNTWPYFREYLQSSLTRMGYPALVAPFLVMKPRARKAGKVKAKAD